MKTGAAKSIGVTFAVCAFLALSLAVARADAPLDPSFGSGGISKPALPESARQARAGIVDLAGAPGGDAVGALGGLVGSGYFGAVRLTAAGTPEGSFGSGGFTAPLAISREGLNPEAQAEAAAVQEDGKVVVAGFVQEGVRGPTSVTPLLARYSSDGTLDPSFGSGGLFAPARPSGWEGFVIHAVAIAADGRIIAVGGRGDVHRGAARAAGVVLAFNSDGSLDRGFGHNGRVLFAQRGDGPTNTSLRAVRVLASGKILAAGYRDYHPLLVELSGDGSLDRGFGGGDGVSELGNIDNGLCCPPAALAVQPDGRIVVATNDGRLARGLALLIRYRPGGALDRGFGERGVEWLRGQWRLGVASDVAVQPDGGILVTGRGESTKRNPHAYAYAVFRSRADGRPDRGFGSHGLRTFRVGRQSYAGAALAQPDGGVLVGGTFTSREKGADRDVTTLLLARFLRP